MALHFIVHKKHLRCTGARNFVKRFVTFESFLYKPSNFISHSHSWKKNSKSYLESRSTSNVHTQPVVGWLTYGYGGLVLGLVRIGVQGGQCGCGCGDVVRFRSSSNNVINRSSFSSISST